LKTELLHQALRAMAEQRGFLAAALVELEGGMVWAAEGDAGLCDAVVSTASDYWRLYRRSQEAFSELGGVEGCHLFSPQWPHHDQRMRPGMLLVAVTELQQDIDWEQWKTQHAQLTKLVGSF
jgi:hypothetical protein